MSLPQARNTIMILRRHDYRRQLCPSIMGGAGDMGGRADRIGYSAVHALCSQMPVNACHNCRNNVAAVGRLRQDAAATTLL